MNPECLMGAILKLKVLHAFRRYLPVTQNWAYNLINATPAIEKHVYSDRFEKTNFYNPEWNFVDFGWSQINLINDALKESRSGLAFRMMFKLVVTRLKKHRKIALEKYVLDNGISIVHSHFGPYACKMAKIIHSTPVKHVVSFYGFDYEQIPFKKPAYLIKYRELFQSASAFICEGTHGKKTLQRMGCPPEKVHIVRLGLSVKQVPFIKRKKMEHSLKLVQIASITEKKGHYYTVRSFLKALQTCPNMTLTIVGSAKSRVDQLIIDDLQAEAGKYGAQDKVFMISKINYADMHRYLAHFDVFIHPSCYARDMDCEGGAPVVLLDCQATGMPVISTNHCDIPDEVVNGETGFLSEEKDTDGLAKSIERFYAMSDQEFQQFSEKARDHVVTNYDIEASGRALSLIYSNL